MAEGAGQPVPTALDEKEILLRDDTLDSSLGPSRPNSKEWKDLEVESVAAPLYSYRLPVDALHRARRLEPWRFDRPHMRAFFFAWSSFFIAFFGWFAVPALLPSISSDKALDLTKANKAHSNAIALSGTVFMRMVTGALVDRFGPRRVQALLLAVFSIPVYLFGTVYNFASFATARFFIGGLGATFVVTEYWCALMFSRNIIGTANAVAAGWGNAGGGATNALMPQFYNLMKVFGLDEEKAWRVVMVIPGTMALIWAVVLFFFSDDCPDGDYKNLYRIGNLRPISALEAFARAARNPRTYVLFCLYASSFGVELTMDNVLATYFNKVFNLDQSIAGVAAGLFGLMNLFARAVGGIGSDLIARRYSMRGRVLWLFANLVLEGVFCLVFSRMTTIGAAIPTLILFSLFTQASCGAVFAIVPFVDPIATGSVGGIVGAGGNTGGVTLSLVFSHMSDPDAVRLISFVVLGISVLSFLLLWPLPVKVTTIGISDAELRALNRLSLQKDDLGVSEQPPDDKAMSPIVAISEPMNTGALQSVMRDSIEPVETTSALDRGTRPEAEHVSDVHPAQKP